MAMPYPPPVPPGQAPPFAIVTDTDHRAWIFIAATLGLSMTMLASGIRVFIRYSSKSTWGLDDFVLATSTVLAFVQTVLVLAAGSNGLGQSNKLVPVVQYDRMQRFKRWEATETIGTTLEVVIFAVAVWILVWNLHAPLQKKVSIVTIFGSRLLIIVVIGLRLASLDEIGFQLNPSLQVASFSCCAQTEMNLSIITVTIPMARVLLANLITHYGGSGGLTARETAAYSSGKQSRKPVSSSIHMDSLRPAISHKDRRLDTRPYIEVRGDDIYDNLISHNRQHRAWTDGPTTSVGSGSEAAQTVDVVSVSSNGSKKMIIRKDVTYQVRYDTEE
ncbi:hypothetical protein DV736_g6552, partial [Chaetothyriales sp. CBS 134916]